MSDENENVGPESGAPSQAPPPVTAPAPVAGGLTGIVRRVTGKDAGEPAPEISTEVPSGDPSESRPGGEPQRGRGPRGPRGPRSERGERPPEARREAVPLPSKRAPLSDDLERELAEALGDQSIDQLVAPQRQAEKSSTEEEGRRRGQVVKVHGDNVFVTMGGRDDGVASLRGFASPPSPGDMVDVIVTGRNREDGLLELNVPGAALSANAADWSELKSGSLVEARISGANLGGLECAVGSIRGFIPASQISVYRVENLGEYVGQKLVCVVTEANERRGNLVLSRRAVLEREKEAAKKQLLTELAPGQAREGVVRKLTDFGAFVDIGGVDGLIHISQLSWDRIKHPSEVLAEGQKVKVRVEKIDPETGKIGLSYRSESDHPWKDIDKKFPVGSVQSGRVSRIADFGAFVKLATGVEGLIHISELAHHKVYAVKNIVGEGQEVQVKVLSVDSEGQRMSLSLKATIDAPQKAKKEKPEEEVVEEPARKPAVPKRGGALKGGTGKSTGGEQFGLKW